MGKGQNARIKRDSFNKRKNNAVKKGSTSTYTSLTLSKILSPLTTSKKGANGNVITSSEDPFNKNSKPKKNIILSKKAELSKHKIKQSARRLKEELDNTNLMEIKELVQPKAIKKNVVVELEKIERYKKLQQEKQLQKEQLNNDFELALEKLGAM